MTERWLLLGKWRRVWTHILNVTSNGVLQCNYSAGKVSWIDKWGCVNRRILLPRSIPDSVRSPGRALNNIRASQNSNWTMGTLSKAKLQKSSCESNIPWLKKAILPEEETQTLKTHPDKPHLEVRANSSVLPTLQTWKLIGLCTAHIWGIQPEAFWK